MEALVAEGHDVTRSAIRSSGESIRELGTYPIGIQVHAGIEATVTLIVEGEGGERAEDYVREEEHEETVEPSDDAPEEAQASEPPAES